MTEFFVVPGFQRVDASPDELPLGPDLGRQLPEVEPDRSRQLDHLGDGVDSAGELNHPPSEQVAPEGSDHSAAATADTERDADASTKRDVVARLVADAVPATAAAADDAPPTAAAAAPTTSAAAASPESVRSCQDARSELWRRPDVAAPKVGQLQPDQLVGLRRSDAAAAGPTSRPARPRDVRKRCRSKLLPAKPAGNQRPPILSTVSPQEPNDTAYSPIERQLSVGNLNGGEVY